MVGLVTLLLAAHPVVAVLPFDETGPMPAGMGAALADLIASDLSTLEGLTVRGSRGEGAPAADFVVVGNLVALGSRVRLTVRVVAGGAGIPPATPNGAPPVVGAGAAVLGPGRWGERASVVAAIARALHVAAPSRLSPAPDTVLLAWAHALTLDEATEAGRAARSAVATDAPTFLPARVWAKTHSPDGGVASH